MWRACRIPFLKQLGFWILHRWLQSKFFVGVKMSDFFLGGISNEQMILKIIGDICPTMVVQIQKIQKLMYNTLLICSCSWRPCIFSKYCNIKEFNDTFVTFCFNWKKKVLVVILYFNRYEHNYCYAMPLWKWLLVFNSWCIFVTLLQIKLGFSVSSRFAFTSTYFLKNLVLIGLFCLKISARSSLWLIFHVQNSNVISSHDIDIFKCSRLSQKTV